MLDSVRYGLAVLTLMTLPWALVFWYVIHPFIGFWRRVGPAGTYGLTVLLGVAMATPVWLWHGDLLAVDYGTGPALWVAAGGFYAAAIAVELRCRKHLKWRTLVGMPELVPGPGGGELLDQGIYGRVRHPRYISVALGMVAAGFFCNYLAVWITVVATMPGLYGIAVVEERELRARFGQAYVEYSARVPRFFPHLSR